MTGIGGPHSSGAPNGSNDAGNRGGDGGMADTIWRAGLAIWFSAIVVGKKALLLMRRGRQQGDGEKRSPLSWRIIIDGMSKALIGPMIVDSDSIRQGYVQKNPAFAGVFCWNGQFDKAFLSRCSSIAAFWNHTHPVSQGVNDVDRWKGKK